MNEEKLRRLMTEALRSEADRRGKDLDAIVAEFHDRGATGDGSASEPPGPPNE